MLDAIYEQAARQATNLTVWHRHNFTDEPMTSGRVSHGRTIAFVGGVNTSSIMPDGSINIRGVNRAPFEAKRKRSALWVADLAASQTKAAGTRIQSPRDDSSFLPICAGNFARIQSD